METPSVEREHVGVHEVCCLHLCLQQLAEGFSIGSHGDALGIPSVEVKSLLGGAYSGITGQQAWDGVHILKHLTYRKQHLIKEIPAVHLIPGIGVLPAFGVQPIGTC